MPLFICCCYRALRVCSVALLLFDTFVRCRWLRCCRLLFALPFGTLPVACLYVAVHVFVTVACSLPSAAVIVLRRLRCYAAVRITFWLPLCDRCVVVVARLFAVYVFWFCCCGLFACVGAVSRLFYVVGLP